jgi:peptidoglycan/LPS O-acetylase OafA/YrhL
VSQRRNLISYHVHGRLSASPAHGWFDGFAFWVLPAVSNGIGAVVPFFVLSGFVLARSLDGNSDAVRFFRNRLFRLFPAAAFVVALLTVLYWRFGIHVGFEASFDPVTVILNLLMIRSDINSVMWSMTVECAATPLILLSVWLFRRYDEPALWGLVAVLLGLSSWGPYVHLLGGYTNLAPLYAFVVGVLIHFRGVRIAVGPILQNILAIVAIVTFCLCGVRTQSALILMLECLSAVTLVALIAWCPAMALFKPLDLGLIRFYGKISYSFYLLHPLGILFVLRTLDPVALNASGTPLWLTDVFTTIASIAATTPAAYLTRRYARCLPSSSEDASKS